jgi:hypothetical protein
MLIALALALAAVPAGAQATPSPTTIFGGYKTVAETEQIMRELAARHPTLATLVDVGDSWERATPGGEPGHDLLALRMTSGRYRGPKPVFTLIAAIHANELPTVEVALRFVSELLESYGEDPTATFILDAHEVVAVPIFNPDGRALALPTRKTTTAAHHPSCRGVDLNRNFPYAWGAIAVSSSPCSTTYLGPSPASEPETQAMMALLSGLYPGRTPPPEGVPFPDTTSGALVSLHTSGDLVLYPWAHTPAQAPNGPALALLAGRLAQLSGYRSIPAYDVYPHAGRLDDWAYAALGVAAYTVEIGGGDRCSGHSAPYDCIDSTFWPENRLALRYAALVSAAPYSLSGGPHVEVLSVAGGPETVAVEATLTAAPGDTVVAAELFLAAAAGLGGIALPALAVDGSLDEGTEIVRATVSRAALDVAQRGDRAPLLLRGRGALGAWGPYGAAWPPETPRGHSVALPLVVR